jgi:hypothetical protein
MRISFFLIAFLFLDVSVFGQTIDGLKTRYGAAHNVFEIRPGVIMSATFGPKQEACEMRIERSIGIDKVVRLDKTFPSYLAKEIVGEVVPESERGAIGTTTTLSMRDIWATTEYFERVSISYCHRGFVETDSNVVAIIISWRHREGCQP